MKKLVLTGKQIRLLIKVENAGFAFYRNVSNFIEENEELPDEENAELEVDDEAFEDVLDMITDYLGAYSIDEEDKPTEQEVKELEELLAQLDPEPPEGTAEGIPETEEESPEDTTGPEEE